MNVLQSYTDFDWEDLPIDEQEFKTTKQVLRLVPKKVKQDTQKKDFILDDIDFELELIHRDQINVAIS
jgi:type I restriction enzyme R subunit